MGMPQLFPFQPYQNMLSLEDQAVAPAHLNDLTHIRSFSTVVLILIDLRCFANQTCVAVGTQVTYCYALTASGSNLYNITVRISAFPFLSLKTICFCYLFSFWCSYFQLNDTGDYFTGLVNCSTLVDLDSTGVANDLRIGTTCQGAYNFMPSNPTTASSSIMPFVDSSMVHFQPISFLSFCTS